MGSEEAETGQQRLILIKREYGHIRPTRMQADGRHHSQSRSMQRPPNPAYLSAFPTKIAPPALHRGNTAFFIA